MGRFLTKSCRLSVMLMLTFGFFLVEIIFGYVTNSTALVADSFHMLSDVLALCIAFFCMKFSRKRQSNKNTFGWIRAEILGALVNAVFLLALCFSIFMEGVKRLIEPEEVEHPVQILIVGAIGLLVNIIGIFMFHGHANLGHSHGGGQSLMDELNAENIHESFDRLNTIAEAHNIAVMADDGLDNDYRGVSVIDGHSGEMRSDEPNLIPRKSFSSSQLNMHGVFLHIMGDAFGSVVVIVNAVICWQVDNVALRKYLDPSLRWMTIINMQKVHRLFFSLCLAMIITCTTVPLLKESASVLLQTVPTHINVSDIKLKLSRSIEGVLGVHELHIWRLAGNKIIATAHIHCKNLEDYMKIAEKVKEFFHREGIHSTTIQPEFAELPSSNCVIVCPGKTKACAPSTCCGPKSESPHSNKTPSGNEGSPSIS